MDIVTRLEATRNQTLRYFDLNSATGFATPAAMCRWSDWL